MISQLSGEMAVAKIEIPRLERSKEHWAIRHAGKVVLAGALGAATVLVLTFTALPGWWAGDKIQGDGRSTVLEVQVARTNAENDVRDLGLRIATGVGALAAAIVAWGRLEMSRAQHKRDDHEQLREDRRQQTERFGRAVEQLGSERIEIRLGGVYSLEQLYADASQERRVIAEVLVAFLRANVPPHRAVPDVASELRPAPWTSDIDGVLRVLRRLDPAPAGGLYLPRIDLSVGGRYRADLSGATFDDANLVGADLRLVQAEGASLTRARLQRADLTNASLNGADLTEAYLTDARLQSARLSNALLIRTRLKRADLSAASLQGADLTGAVLDDAKMIAVDLSGADLSGARLVRVNLSAANLANATLVGTNLDGADLVGAVVENVIWSTTTQWPVGFVPPGSPLGKV
jgi:uncharacterized protein YjbI with pentapeptide repeats